VEGYLVTRGAEHRFGSRALTESVSISLCCSVALTLELWAQNVKILPDFPKWEADVPGKWTCDSLDWDSGAPRPSWPTPDL
jgi:hypothetical protein